MITFRYKIWKEEAEIEFIEQMADLLSFHVLQTRSERQEKSSIQTVAGTNDDVDEIPHDLRKQQKRGWPKRTCNCTSEEAVAKDNCDDCK